MPIYEYTCHDCKRRVSLLWRSYADAAERPAVCPRCSGTHLTRLMSRVAVLRSEESRIDDLSSPDDMSGLDENDPKSLARFMRKMADETGEGLGPEFDEVVGRLEAGEDPEKSKNQCPTWAPAAVVRTTSASCSPGRSHRHRLLYIHHEHDCPAHTDLYRLRHLQPWPLQGGQRGHPLSPPPAGLA